MTEAGASDALERARELAPAIAHAAAESEAERRLAPALVRALHQARLYRLLLPRALGGDALDLVAFSHVIEALARADGSTGWCVCQGNGCAQSAGFLATAAAREVFGAPDAVLAWGPGSATVAEVPGGYRLSGRWTFASGIRQATWLGCYVPVIDEATGRPRLAADRTPLLRTFVFPAAAASIIDVWHVLGLRATGSEAYETADIFVPAERSFLRDTPLDRSYPLYRYTINGIYMAGFPGVALGIARAMLDDFVALARDKRPRLGPGRLAEDGVVQSELALAEAKLRSARAFLDESLALSWRGAEANGRVSLEHRIANRLASTYAIHQAREVADRLYHASGAGAIYESNALERRMRDIIAVSQHLQARQSHYQTVGQFLLGLEPDLAVT
jgi:alkylation response protein AidB-like acyl-CoA dehydrogenase